MTDARPAGITLSRKLLVLGALPAILMFLVLMGFFTSARLDDARQTLADNGQLLADSLAPALEYPVVSGNTQALEQILSQSLKNSLVDWIRVTDVVGNVIGQVPAPDDTSSGREPARYQTFEAEILQQPLTIGSNEANAWFELDYGFNPRALRVGTITVGVSTQALQARLQDILWTSIAIGTALLVLTVVIIRYFLGNLLAPIHGVSERVDRLIRRQYDRPSVSRKDSSRELIEIGEKLNQLSMHLEALDEGRNQMLAASEAARQRAESANESKSQFLATMSQELRTPLQGVLGTLDRVQGDPLTPCQQDYLNTARQSTEDLLTVINDLLDYAHLGDGSFVLERREFDLRRVIANCAASYRVPAEQQGLSLKLRFFGDWPAPCRVTGDPGRLRQVVACLLDHAIRFTDEGTIDLHAHCQPGAGNRLLLRCTVSDSGPALAADRLGDLLHAFEQRGAPQGHAQGRTGLGLSLVQRLVELMGGHVHLETEPGHPGATFRFELPFEQRVDGDVSP
ncbi:ATP-binding protein [uncultured Marinobacter sp.]|jgi:signal transduction histidine kinase|uniref:sensor histidine kinase n=1 Tax=uncultured Marinobacter sp. TaxID=187379 RepID=UPI000C0A4F92|nr:hybrid sensor histidine kinase/response regulator [Marinobacter sp.]MBI42426.1 hybrid sensor histidine kinase/response regulator [Oceanospirillales bacterium]|tara:strand:+ start:2605 stop:4140 length:1536 start_codon:yes stop_codon:yes gene_type:complete